MPDPWAEAAKNYKPTGQGEAAPASNTDYKVWQQPDSGNDTQPEGFWHSVGAQVGITPEAGEARRQEFVQHPIKTTLKDIAGPALPLAEGMASYGKRLFHDAYDAGQSLAAGNPSQAGVDAVDAIPILGPAELKAADQYGEGNIAGAAGTVLGAAPQGALALEGGLRSLGRDPHFIPSAERAGAVFDRVGTAMQGKTVPLTARTIDPLEQAQKLTEAGHGTVSALDKLYGRSNQIAPMDFEEARMRSSALSRLTGQDKLTGSKWLQSEAKLTGSGLRADTSDATAQVGMQPQFDKAMREYAQAARLKDLIDASKSAVKKHGAAAGATAVGAGLGYKVLKDIEASR